VAYAATSPTRDFLFVVDPLCFDALSRPYDWVALLIRDLLDLGEVGVRVVLLLPTYLSATVQDEDDLPRDLADSVTLHTDAGSVPAYQPVKRMSPTATAALLADTSDAHRARVLVALAELTQADGVVTTNRILVEQRWPLYQYHRVRVTPFAEFGDVVEWCARGHALFWSSRDPVRQIPSSLYYQQMHTKSRRLTEWFFRVETTLRHDRELHENLRSALVSRYPFILYSRDMVRFYELQNDHFGRRGHHRRFGWALGYYITAFYLHVWGMLEQLTIIANRRLGLRLDDEDCGIHKTKTFWKAIDPVEPALRRVLKSEPFATWTAVIADARHAAAHRAMLLPNALVTDTPESNMTDAEVAARLREEDPEFYDVMPPHVATALEPTRIWHWRMRHLETVGENVVVVKGKAGNYMRGAVVSIDYDLEMLEAAMDAFLVGTFRRRPMQVPPAD